MKLIVFGIFSALFLGVVAMGADKILQTNSSPGVEAQGDEEDRILESSVEGFIKTLGASGVSDSGTHILGKEDGNTLLLVGLRVNLDSYVGKKAIVRGRMAPTPSGKELMQVLSIDLPDADESIGQTQKFEKTWSDFSNGDLGVSFQKRGNWKETTSVDKILFEIEPVISLEACDTDPCPAKIADFIAVERFKNEQNKTLDQYVKSLKLLSVKNKVGVDLLMAEKVSGADGRIDLYLQRDAYFYIFSYRPGEKKISDPNRNDFFQLLSTFRFVPHY